MIVTDTILRLVTGNKSKFFILKDDKYYISYHGINFSIFYQLLCQKLKLYSTEALQNRKLDKKTRKKERKRLMIVHEELDKTELIFNKHKTTFSTTELNLSNRLCIHKKDMRFFIDTVLIDSLNRIKNASLLDN